MAASDYQILGAGGLFNTIAELQNGVGPLDTEIALIGFRRANGDVQNDNEGVMIGDEICRIVTFSEDTLIVARGCADTIPRSHDAGTLVWFFDGTVGAETESNDHVGGETIGVKVLPSTVGGASLAIADSPPNALTFDFRFARPYPPARVEVNGGPWIAAQLLDEDDPALIVTWVHRDRILQADQLISHVENSVGPEPGTTYRLQVFKEDNSMVRDAGPIEGASFIYPWVSAKSDFGLTPTEPGPVAGYMRLWSERDGFQSWNAYRIDFTVDGTETPPPPAPAPPPVSP